MDIDKEALGETGWKYSHLYWEAARWSWKLAAGSSKCEGGKKRFDFRGKKIERGKSPAFLLAKKPTRAGIVPCRSLSQLAFHGLKTL